MCTVMVTTLCADMSKTNMDLFHLSAWVFILATLVPVSVAQKTETNPPSVIPRLPSPPSHIPDTPIVVINEFDISDQNTGQYIELFDGGLGNVSMSGLELVLFEGVEGKAYTDPISLNNTMTNDKGYFLLSTSAFIGVRGKTIVNLRNEGLNAIALYNVTNFLMNRLEFGSRVTNFSLLDAVVYGNTTDAENILVSTLLPKKSPLQDLSYATSLSRCRGWHGLMPQAFWTVNKTPLRENWCELPSILFNEVNVRHTVSLDDSFIELYDGGVGNQCLDGIIMAFYHSQLDLSFLAIDLTNYTTNEEGFFVIAAQPNNHSYDLSIYDHRLQESQRLPKPEGIALHLASPRRFQNLVRLNNYRLIDAVVYGSPNTTDLTVLHTLLPYQALIREVTGTNRTDLSSSRCLCCRSLDSSSFGEGPLTPGSLNVNCTLSNRTLTETGEKYQQLVRINEVKLMDPERPDKVGEYIELSVNGYGLVNLDGMVLVIYGSNTMSYRTISLDGYVTNEAGYFLIGKSGMRPTPDITIEDDEPLISGAGAVALYKGSADDFPDGTLPFRRSGGLLDAIVFGFPGDLVLRLLYYLTQGQDLVELQPPGDNPLPSILRCFSLRNTTQLAYVTGVPSPGVANNCPLPPIFINEVNVIPDMTTSRNGTAEFLEISSNGTAYFPLDTLAVVLWNSFGPKPTAVGAIGLYGWTTDQNGLFVIAQSQVQGTRPSFPVSLSNTIRLAPGAISIHVGRPGMFPPLSKLTNQSLVDALVFGVSQNDVVPQELMDVLTPGRDWFHEDELVKYEDVSINRCERENGKVEYILDNISPNATNYCPRQTDTKIMINEVHLTSTFEMYIELWDMGVGYTEMTGLQLVFFQEDGKFIMAQNLTGQTDSRGYYIVGHFIRPAPDRILSLRFQLRRGGAVAIYETPQAFNIGDDPTSVGLMSAVVHVLGPVSEQGLRNFNTLTPESAPFVQTNVSALSTSGITLSRCFNSSLRVTSEAFLPKFKTIRSLNDCPVLPEDVYINEVEVTRPRGFIPFVYNEFIELYDGGRGNTTMKYLTLVLFDGGVPFFGGYSSDTSFFAVSLDGLRTNSDGYFVIGSSSLNASVVDLPIDTSIIPFLQLGIVGIALYRGHVGAFPAGFNATNTSLIDALIYVTGKQEVQHSLVNILLPDAAGAGMVRETGSWLEGNGSISRCLGNQRWDPQAYILTEVATPRKKNNCSSITHNFTIVVLINEVNLDGDSLFVELYDLGAGSTSLDTLILVFYVAPTLGSDQPVSALVVDLHGNKTKPNGYFVVGSDPSSDRVVSAGFRGIPYGVGLYHAKSVQFPIGTLPTTQNLIDAVVVNDSDNNALAGALLPGQVGVSDMDLGDLERSVSRCFAKLPLDMFAFLPTKPTPGQSNDCSRKEVVINEINIDHESFFGRFREFIELYDGGVGHTPLTGIVVVIYIGERNNSAYRVIPLNNTQTNKNGYFVIGRPNLNFTADLQVYTFAELIPNNAGGIALYHDDMRNYQVGMPPTNQNLQDAIVYGSQTINNVDLLDHLLPGQSQVIEDESFLNGDESIIRCKCCEPLQASVYKQGPPTAGRENICMGHTTMIPPTMRPPLTAPATPEVLINEIGISTGMFHSEYIELKGTASIAMDNYFIVLYDSGGASYLSLQLGKAMGPEGFFLIGSPNMSPPPHVRLQFNPQGHIGEKAGAVALYYGYSTDIPKGTQATAKNLVDAVVYTANADNPVGGQVYVLTTQPDQFFADLRREESISRCFWSTVRNNEDFTQTLRTPGNENNCPSEEFKNTMQMKLTDADYSEWQNNAELLTSLREKIIDGVNAACKCGFNYHYITDEALLEGSVVYQAAFLAFNANQSSQIYLGFSAFVRDSKTLEIGGTTYQVDKCVEDCVVVPTSSAPGETTKATKPKVTPKMSTTAAGKGVNGTRHGKKGDSTGIAVGVTVAMILLIVVGVGVVFILIRKRIICYEKDIHLTEGDSKKFDDIGDGMEFKNNTYEPAY